MFVYVSQTDPHNGRKKSIQFACQFEALGSGILHIQKQFQNPKTLRILELFSDLRYSTSMYLKLAGKVKQLFSSRHYTDSHSDQEKLIPFACQLGCYQHNMQSTWKWNIANLKTVPES